MITPLAQFLANKGMNHAHNDWERDKFFAAAALVEDCGEPAMLMQVGNIAIIAAALADWKSDKTSIDKNIATFEVNSERNHRNQSCGFEPGFCPTGFHDRGYP